MKARSPWFHWHIPWILVVSVALLVLGCSRYPATPRDVVVEFVKATQSEKSDARNYLSTSLKSSLSEKGFKYTFGEAVVQQSVPQADEKHAILVKKIRLGAGRVVIVTDMRVVVSKERDRWVISQIVAGVPDPGASGNSDWLRSDGVGRQFAE